MMKSKLPSSLTEHTLWENSQAPIWLSTSFILKRNFARYCFPSKLSPLESNQIFAMMKQKIEKTPLLNNPSFFPIKDLSPIDREYLFEHFLTLDAFGPTQDNQAFIVDNSYRFFGCINVEDHLRLQCIEPSHNWENTWNILNQLESYLASPLEYAYSRHFGFLTSDPSFCGTGLVGQAFLHLPAILQMNHSQEAFANEIEEEIFPRGMGNSSDGFIGDIVVLQNRFTLGLTEDTILHALHNSASKLMRAEETLQNHLRETSDPVIKDKISRAFGLLSHSYQLETKEVLAALSLLKLGLNLGWITQMTQQQINDIFFKCRRAHLLFSKEEEISQEQLPHKRAEYLHQQLKGVQLAI